MPLFLFYVNMYFLFKKNILTKLKFVLYTFQTSVLLEFICNEGIMAGY